MNARVRNFRAKFCAKFRENRTFRIRTLYRLREIRTLWHTAQDTLAPGPGHYGARHSLRVSGADPTYIRSTTTMLAIILYPDLEELHCDGPAALGRPARAWRGTEPL